MDVPHKNDTRGATDLSVKARVPLVALVVLDGWGCAPPGPGNAVALASTPVFDDLLRRFSHTTLDASGEAVGLPAGQMGNSEVGHVTVGAGRTVDQDLLRLNRSIQSGEFFENPALVGAFERARTRGGAVHLIGLVSYGGVHSHIDHLRALAELARRLGHADRTVVHAFTDGRDVSPHAAAGDIAELVAEGATIATVCGRYYAMDRDRRWERTDRAVQALVNGTGLRADDPEAAVRESYARSVTDEFIEPTMIGDAASTRLRENDSVVVFNFRPDRARQLSQRLVEGGFDLTTMTRYSDALDCPVAFAEVDIAGTLAEVVAGSGARQLHAAETEKYAHVTYFLNGGREEPWPGEERILVPSPADVATYDQCPSMSASEVASRFSEELARGEYAFAIVNFANPDMVGHTGVLQAVVEAVEATDTAMGVVVDAVSARGGVCLVFADHGNAEQMIAEDGVSPHTAHSTNRVPLVVTLGDATVETGGTLADLAPTALALLGVERPAEMSGRVLVHDG